jgi:hypothetical protein
MTTQTDDEDLIRRAFSAWFRSGGTQQPAVTLSTVEELDEKVYVVLRNSNEILAVYRVRPSDGVLRRMKRWPHQIV